MKKPSHTRGMTRLLWRRERDSNPCEIALKRFSRPPRYDHFDIPPYKRNYEIVLEKTLEEKTLLSEKCACSSQIQGFFAGYFRYGKEVSRPPRYDRFDNPPYLPTVYGNLCIRLFRQNTFPSTEYSGIDLTYTKTTRLHRRLYNKSCILSRLMPKVIPGFTKNSVSRAVLFPDQAEKHTRPTDIAVQALPGA